MVSGFIAPFDENTDPLLPTCCCLGARCGLLYRLEPSGSRLIGFAMFGLLGASFCAAGMEQSGAVKQFQERRSFLVVKVSRQFCRLTMQVLCFGVSELGS